MLGITELCALLVRFQIQNLAESLFLVGSASTCLSAKHGFCINSIKASQNWPLYRVLQLRYIGTFHILTTWTGIRVLLSQYKLMEEEWEIPRLFDYRLVTLRDCLSLRPLHAMVFKPYTLQSGGEQVKNLRAWPKDWRLKLTLSTIN